MPPKSLIDEPGRISRRMEMLLTIPNSSSLQSKDTTTTHQTFDMPTFKNVPSAFICPLSMQVMVQPLVTKSGQHFERSAILAWLAQGSGKCPITGTSMRPSDLVPDRRLEAKLSFWRQANNVVLSSVIAEKQDVFIGIAALGERKPVSPSAPKSRGLFPRIFRSSKVSAISA
jgi:hypothetical protein